MGCFGGGSTPSPPGFSTEERDLFQKQGWTLDQFNEQLQQENLDKQTTKDLLKNLSGLWKTTTTAGVKGEDITTHEKVFDTKKVAALRARLTTADNNTVIQNYISDPKIIVELQSQGIDTSRTFRDQAQHGGDGKAKTLNAFDRFAASAQQDLERADYFGFTMDKATVTPGTVSEDITESSLDPDAVARLRGRIKAEQDAQNTLKDQGNEFLQGFLNKPKSEYEKLQEEAGVLSARRLVSALKGALPVSPELVQSKAKDFEQLKAHAGKQGVIITGDAPGSATTDSTVGAAMLGEFNKRYDYAENLDRRGEIDSGTSQNLQRYGLISDLGSTKFNQATTLAGGPSSTSGPINLATMGLQSSAPDVAGYGSLLQGYSLLQQPYANQRTLLYQKMLTDASNKRSGDMAWGQLGTQLLMAGLLA